MSAFAIRPGTLSDVETLVAFNLAMAAESEDTDLDPARLTAGVRAALEDATLGTYYIAHAHATDPTSSDAVGALMITYEWSDWRNGLFWWIQSVYVEPAWRRRGVYRALHGHVRELARADPRSCGIRLYVERENHGAMATYDALGMAETYYRLYEESWQPRGS